MERKKRKFSAKKGNDFGKRDNIPDYGPPLLTVLTVGISSGLV